MPARKAYQGHTTPPSGQQGTQRPAAAFRPDFYYFVQVADSDHFGIEKDPTSGPLKRPFGVLGSDHLSVRGAATAGTHPLRSLEGSTHLQISG